MIYIYVIYMIYIYMLYIYMYICNDYFIGLKISISFYYYQDH